MTRIERVKEMVRQMSEFLNIPYVSDDNATHPEDITFTDLNFITYRLTVDHRDSDYNAVETLTPVPGDDTKLVKRRVTDEDFTVSISFLSRENNYPLIWGYAERGVEWLESAAAITAAGGLELFISTINELKDLKKPGDLEIDKDYKSRIGFDVKMRYKNIIMETLDTVDINATVEEIIYEQE